MSILQKMEEECNCVEVIFQDYIQSRSTNEIFLFFEGIDDYKYYWCRLSPFVGTKSYKKYDCNGKNNVITIYEMINTKAEKKQNEKKLYFVDKDFDKERLNIDEIYVTHTYAIENLYITDIALKNMIIGEFGLSGHMDQFDKQDLDKAFNYLVSKREEMIESMIYANAWYSLQYNKTKYRRMYPKLSAIKDYYVIKDVKDKEKLKSLVPNAIEVTNEEIEEEIKYLRALPVERLRGKYFEQMMPTYIMKVFQDSNKKNNREMFSKRRKISLNVSKENLISVLSNYAEVSEDLIAYIAKRFNVDKVS